MDAHEGLVATRNLLDRGGWLQNCWHREGEGRCIGGALKAATGGFGAAGEALNVVIGLPPGDDLGRMDWNNAPGRTTQDVLSALDTAIAATAPDQ